MKIEGKVWRYGDNIDTDVIIPARYLNTFDPAELAKHCMEDIDKTFAANVKAGDIIVGGKNFGCGSSREHAPIAIKASGVGVVIARSYARIFYRNAINMGLGVIEIGEAVERIRGGDELEVEGDEVRNKSRGEVYKVREQPEFVMGIATAGGLIEYVKRHG